MAENKKTKEDETKKPVENDTKSVKKDDGKEQELSEEDKQLVEDLNTLVLRLTESDDRLYKPALESLRVHIRSSTTSMTSVPKPLKFLRTHFTTLKEVYDKIVDPPTKKFCADVISVLAMTSTEGRECLKYRLLGSYEEIGSWGHEYVRHLSGELSQDWEEKEKAVVEVDGMRDEAHFKLLLDLVLHIVPYLMKHNAEAEACDLLMDISRLDLLEQFTDESVQTRVCLYLKSCVPYDSECVKILTTALNIYRKFNKHAEALLCAIQLGNKDLVAQIIKECPDRLERKQLAYILGTHQVVIPMQDLTEDGDELAEIASNSHLNTNFLNLARELDILEPKVPEDIYKSHLEPNRPSVGSSNVDSARQNLAFSFVNGFVNAAFAQDKLLMEDGNKWLYRNKEHGMMSATATLGLIQLWDIDGGLSQIDKYLYTNDEYIKAGALLACGIVNCGVRNECDPALALLSDYVTKGDAITRIGCIVGLGLAYAGSNREDVLDHLTAALSDSSSSSEVLGMAALACGMVAVGSGNAKVVSSILTCLVEKSEADLKDNFAKFLALGLGLTYLGRQDEVDDTTVTALEVLPEPYKSMAQTLLEVCGYAATGNVLKVQKMLHICSDHYDTKDQENNEKKDDKTKKKETTLDLSIQQAIAVLGIGLVAMGDDIGAEMSLRTFGHLLRYGEPVIRRSVPLALALMWASNPRLNILETLSKFSHDADSEVACNSILAMGIVGAGTNNARLATLLRQLAVFHAKDPNSLFCVRIAQGITHLGKGTLTLCPFYSDRQIVNPVSVAGLLAVLVACLDIKSTILSKSHYILFHLAASIHPRMLITFNEEGRPLPVSVRVGQAVDVVGQAGKPKTITGFQTHTTPVLLAYGERAELATEEYIALSPIMEGFVILKKNPDYEV